MKKIITAGIGLLMLVCMLFSLLPIGGRGDALATQYGTSIAIIQDAISGKAGTWIFENSKGSYLFAKTIEDGIGIVGLDINSTKSMFDVSNGTLKGCVSDCKTISDLLRYIQNNGWKGITGAEVPLALRTLVKTSAFYNLVKARAVGISDLIVIPVFPFLNPPDGILNEKG